MQISLENIEELTENYLKNSFSEEEKVVFEEAVEKDIALKQAFEEHRDAILAVELSGIKNQLNTFFENEKNQKVTKFFLLKTKWKKYSGIAASLLLIVSFGYILFFQKHNNEKLYAKFFYKDEGLPVTMGIAKNQKFDEGMIAYKSNDFQKSIIQFQELISEKTANDTIQYFLAMSYLNENKSKESISLLNQIIEYKETTFRKEAEYFLALAYLKNNQIEKAKTILKYSKHERAKELLENIK